MPAMTNAIIQLPTNEDAVAVPAEPAVAVLAATPQPLQAPIITVATTAPAAGPRWEPPILGSLAVIFGVASLFTGTLVLAAAGDRRCLGGAAVPSGVMGRHRRRLGDRRADDLEILLGPARPRLAARLDAVIRGLARQWLVPCRISSLTAELADDLVVSSFTAFAAVSFPCSAASWYQCSACSRFFLMPRLRPHRDPRP